MTTRVVVVVAAVGKVASEAVASSLGCLSSDPIALAIASTIDETSCFSGQKMAFKSVAVVATKWTDSSNRQA